MPQLGRLYRSFGESTDDRRPMIVAAPIDGIFAQGLPRSPTTQGIRAPRFAIACALAVGLTACSGSSSAGGPAAYSHDGDACESDADCTVKWDDQVLRAVCEDGACRGVSSIEEHGAGQHDDSAASIRGPAPDAHAGRLRFEQAQAFYADREFAAAARGFTSSCELGHARGCHVAGNMYRLGRGVAKDLRRAETFFLKACDEEGYPEACHNLAQVRAEISQQYL